MNGDSGRVHCKCGHAPSVGSPQHMLVVLVPFSRVTPLKNTFIARGVERVGLPRCSALRGSYLMYRLVAGGPEAVESLIESFSRTDLFLRRKGEAGDLVWLNPLVVEIGEGDFAKRRHFQCHGPWFSVSGPRMIQYDRDESFHSGTNCTAKVVVARRDHRDTSTVGGALTAPMVMDNGAKCFVLSKCTDIDQVGCSKLGSVAGPDDAR